MRQVKMRGKYNRLEAPICIFKIHPRAVLFTGPRGFNDSRRYFGLDR